MRYKHKKAQFLIPITISIAVIFGYILGKTSVKSNYIDTAISQFNTKDFLDNINNNSTKLGTILSLIDTKYVEHVNVDTLSEEYIQKILAKLDPHSSYISAEDAIASYEALNGSFEGIGIMFNMATDTLIIQDVISGGPSEKVGILAGDRIIQIGDSVIAGRNVNQDSIVKMLKGPSGTKVQLGIERRGAKGLIGFEVTRGKIAQNSIDAAFLIEPEIGYIKLSRFARTSHKEFVSAIERMRAEGMKQLIFDLTYNSGGYLDQAILIANEFLPAGNMIVYTEGLNYPMERTYANGKGKLIDQPVVVLIDENSASASEIVAGALQDNDIGTIIGRRSYGKGLVQEQIILDDGSIVNLTIARYHTPTGRCIQRSYENGTEQYILDFYERYVHNEHISADSITFPDSLKYTTPKGKVVYGGGGIMPDVFVPKDTTSQGSYFVEVMNNNTLFSFTLSYLDEHRAEIKALDTKDKLIEYFRVNDQKIFNQFKNFARSKQTKNSLDQLSIKNCKIFINAYLARNSGFGDSGYYLFMYPFSEIIVEALDNLHE
ncbi:MAG: S41 family peptidase [Rikenellaceae bacterium]